MAVVFPFQAIGTTLAVTTSTYDATWQVHSINFKAGPRGSVKTTHMATVPAVGTPSYHTYIPSKIIDPGEATVVVSLDGNKEPPVADPGTGTTTVDTFVLTVANGTTTQATWTWTGFFTDFETDLKDDVDEVVMATLKIKLASKVVVVAGT